MGNDDHLHKAFAFFDHNKNGYIEIEELREALADEVDTNSEEVINAIIQDVDTDKVDDFASLSFSSLVSYYFVEHRLVFEIHLLSLLKSLFSTVRLRSLYVPNI